MPVCLLLRRCTGSFNYNMVGIWCELCEDEIRPGNEAFASSKLCAVTVSRPRRVRMLDAIGLRKAYMLLQVPYMCMIGDLNLEYIWIMTLVSRGRSRDFSRVTPAPICCYLTPARGGHQPGQPGTTPNKANTQVFIHQRW